MGATGFLFIIICIYQEIFATSEQNFWNLINDAILCDVAVEQVEITGSDASKFAQLQLHVIYPNESWSV